MVNSIGVRDVAEDDGEECEECKEGEVIECQPAFHG
jgi:hypothetical protein